MDPLTDGFNGTIATDQEFRMFKISKDDIPENLMADPLGVFLYFHLTSQAVCKMYLRVDQLPSEYVFDVDSNLRRQVRLRTNTPVLMTCVRPRPT